MGFLGSQKQLEGSLYGAVGTFDDDQELVHAIEKIRRQGYSKLEAYTPFPIHGIDEALGARQSTAGLVCCLLRPDRHNHRGDVHLVGERGQLLV